jgi:hypothetical protein
MIQPKLRYWFNVGNPVTEVVAAVMDELMYVREPVFFDDIPGKNFDLVSNDWGDEMDFGHTDSPRGLWFIVCEDKHYAFGRKPQNYLYLESYQVEGQDCTRVELWIWVPSRAKVLNLPFFARLHKRLDGDKQARTDLPDIRVTPIEEPEPEPAA